MPLVRLQRSSSVVDAAFDAFEAKEWTGPLLTHRSRLGARRKEQKAAQSSEPAPPEPRKYRKDYGYYDNDLVQAYFRDYSESLKSKGAYDKERKALNDKLYYIYENHTNKDGRLTDDEAVDMRDAHARMHALQILGQEPRFKEEQPEV